jgi:hypothetical protein
MGFPYLPVRGKTILSMPAWLSAAKKSSIILRILIAPAKSRPFENLNQLFKRESPMS